MTAASPAPVDPPHRVAPSRRVAAEAASTVVACRFTPSEARDLEELARAHQTSPGKLLRSWGIMAGTSVLRPAPRATGEPLGSLLTSAVKWVVALCGDGRPHVDALEEAGRALADARRRVGLMPKLPGSGAAVVETLRAIVDELVVDGDLAQLEAAAKLVNDGLEVVRRRSKHDPPEPPASGPRAVKVELTQAARDDYAQAIAAALDVVDLEADELVSEVAGADKSEQARVAVVLAELERTGAVTREGTTVHLVREEELDSGAVAEATAPVAAPDPLDSDPVAEMAAAAPPAAPVLRVDPLARIVWPPKGWRREPTKDGKEGTPPSPGVILRRLAEGVPLTMTEMTCIEWPTVGVTWIEKAVEILRRHKLVTMPARVGREPWVYATALGREAAQLTPEERTIDLPLPGVAPPRAQSRAWRRTWIGRGKAHTVSVTSANRTVCGAVVAPPKWRTAPAEADDCTICKKNRITTAPGGAAKVWGAELASTDAGATSAHTRS